MDIEEKIKAQSERLESRPDPEPGPTLPPRFVSAAERQVTVLRGGIVAALETAARLMLAAGAPSPAIERASIMVVEAAEAARRGLR